MDTLRLTSGLAFALFLIYWLFETVARAQFGLDLPNPAALLPAGWRFH